MMTRTAYILLIAATTALTSVAAEAQTVPSSADASRIQAPSNVPVIRPYTADVNADSGVIGTVIPDNASDIRFTLNQITIQGGTIFDNDGLARFYAEHLGNEITLETVWNIANNITRYYHEQGYFLARAYVPQQQINNGMVQLSIVEGYIASVNMDDALHDHPVIQDHIDALVATRPLSSQALESFILRLNDLHGQQFFGALMPLENSRHGAVGLTVQRSDKIAKNSISLDNNGSRFLGPYQANVTMRQHLVDLHETTFQGSLSMPADELKYISLRHDMPIVANWNMHASASYIDARPGASLEINEIESEVVNAELGVRYQAIRQRHENLSFAAAVAVRQVDTDILGNTELTRDRIRTLGASIDYDVSDAWSGYNYILLGVRQGLDIFGASSEGDQLLSRSDAAPDFTLAHMSYIRQQLLADHIMMIAQTSGQASSKPLFSSEEFGAGGQRFGRAYDPSEITGDHGVSASVEVRYLHPTAWHKVSLSPYAFYDIGKVWNIGSDSADQSLSSAGFGVRAAHSSGLSSNIGLAFPLTKSVDTPIYGDNHDPRLLLKLGYNF